MIKNKKISFFSQIAKISFALFFISSILIIIGLLIISIFKINYKKNQFQSQIEILKKQIEALEKQNQKLKSSISESQTDFFVEKKLREDLGLKKPGEEVIVILHSDKEQKEIEPKKNFWQKFLDLFN